MHTFIESPHSTSVFSYPTPPYTSESAADYSSSESDEDHLSMGAATIHGMTNVDGVGVLTYQRAIDIARNTEGDLDPNVSAYLEGALHNIWSRIQQEPNNYIMSNDEFAVFNYYRTRTEGDPLAEQAVARYWRSRGQTAAGAS